MNAPFFHLAVALLAGILLSSPATPLSVRVAAGLLAGGHLLYLFLDPRARRTGWMASAALAAGLLLPHVRMPWHAEPVPLSSDRVDLVARVDTPLDRGRSTDHVFLRLEKIERAEKNVPVAGRARLTLYWTGADLKYGDRVRVSGVRLHRPKGFGNPGSFDYETYLAARGIVAVGGVSRPAQLALLERGTGSPLLSWLYSVRERLLGAIQSGLPPREAAVLSALLYGERRTVPSNTQSDFYISGTGHLLAISGLHVGFVVLFLFGSLRWGARRVPRGICVRLPAFLTPDRLAALGAIPLLLAYMILAGARVTTVRATIMVVSYLLARFLQRDRDHFNTLGLAALLILLWDSRFLFDVGFQLSFVAVLVILVTARTFVPKDKLRDFIRVTVLVSLAMIPILAFHFHRVSLYGVAANLALIPVASILVPAGLVASVLGAAIPSLSSLLFFPVQYLALLLVEGARWFAVLPKSALRIPPPTPLMLLALYGPAAAWLLLRRHRNWTRLAVGASLAVLGVSVLWTSLGPVRSAHRGELEMIFLDVGDADATFVRLPDGRTLLVDAAGKLSETFDVGEAVVVPYLEKHWVRRLDYVLLTHPERNHAGGAPAVFQALSVGELWESGLPSANPLRARVLRAAEERGVPVRRLRRGATIPGRGYRIEVLHPLPQARTARRRPDNDQSVVLRLTHGKVRVLLTGDLERKGERVLIRSGQDLRAEVLRVPHHGSSTSSSPALLREVRPRAAVISAGRPWMGHPSRAVLSRYEGLGTAVFRTDWDGAVRVWSDGETYRVESTLRPRRSLHARAAEIPPAQAAAGVSARLH
ncbi:MAG: DNA internalization-related competence protein ComEC/Rec2 [Candidatus Tectomicrobia bacterium]|nr:DNA internalization-related competence protein ComEC/Rec2 [Candidatus Tectomicrobia bacterium]